MPERHKFRFEAPPKIAVTCRGIAGKLNRLFLHGGPYRLKCWCGGSEEHEKEDQAD